MNFDNLNIMCEWEQTKTFFLIETSKQLGMDIKGEGEIGVNQSNGNIYLCLEDYNFTLYMPITCDLVKENIYILWSNSEDGTEEERPLGNLRLADIQEWTDNLDNISRRSD